MNFVTVKFGGSTQQFTPTPRSRLELVFLLSAAIQMCYLSDENSIKLSVQLSPFALLAAYTGELQLWDSVTMHFPAQHQQKNVSRRENKGIVEDSSKDEGRL